MSKITRVTISIIILIIASTVFITATYNNDLQKSTRIIISVVYMSILTIMLFGNILLNYRNKH